MASREDRIRDNTHATLEIGHDQMFDSPQRRKRKIIWAVVGVSAVVIIVVTIVLAVTLTGNGDKGGNGDGDDDGDGDNGNGDDDTDDGPAPPPGPMLNISLDDIIGGRFSPTSFSGSWVSGNSLMLRNDEDDLILRDITDNSNSTLIYNSTEGAGALLRRSSRFLELSSEKNFVGFSYDVVSVYRYSFLAHYAAVSVADNSIIHKIIPPVAATTDDPEPALQNFVWSPRGTGLAFVYKNNVFYKANLEAEPQQITTNGILNVVYNGIPDWVYEEEVFSSNNALWFSKDGSRLAYATFNDTDVRIMNIPHYGVPGSLSYQYTAHSAIRYPKPGTNNPTVTVTLRNLQENTETLFKPPSKFDESILFSVTFVSDNELAMVWTNRVQNQMIVQLCKDGSTCSEIFQYSEPYGWIENVPLVFNSEGNSFVTILPYAVSGSNDDENSTKYKQVVQVSKNETETEWIMQRRSISAHTVIEIYKWTDNDIIWYKATAANDSAAQHVFSIDDNNTETCFTCSIRRSDDEACLYNEAMFSTDAQKIMVNCMGPGVPQIYLYDTTGELIREWELNDELNEAISKGVVPWIMRRTVPIGDGFPDAEVLLQVPNDYRTRFKIPLLVYVYGGPDTALVTHAWNLDWGSSLVTRYGIAIAHIDARGSGLRGTKNMFAVNRRLGTVEIDDQINVTRYLQQNLRWVDSEHTCIWGWSYGGYASSMALARGGDVFKCAIAVAPVTDWRFYDTIYTERYMDVPQNNTEGYARGSVLSEEHINGFRNKSYFLVHGTADDNVHFQHAMVLSKKLQVNDVFFQQMGYTDEDHSLGNVRNHLYHGLEKFLKENMQLS